MLLTSAFCSVSSVVGEAIEETDEKKVEEKQELKKVEGKEKQESEGRYEMHFQL